MRRAVTYIQNSSYVCKKSFFDVKKFIKKYTIRNERVDGEMSKVTEQALDTVKAHIDAIVDGSVVITVADGKITLVDSENK